MLNPICPLLAVPGDDGDDIVVQNVNYHLTSLQPNEDEDEGMQTFEDSSSIPFLQDRVSDRPVTDRLPV